MVNDFNGLQYHIPPIFVESAFGCWYRKQSHSESSSQNKVLARAATFFKVQNLFRIDNSNEILVHIYCSWFLGWVLHIVVIGPKY